MNRLFHEIVRRHKAKEKWFVDNCITIRPVEHTDRRKLIELIESMEKK